MTTTSSLAGRDDRRGAELLSDDDRAAVLTRGLGRRFGELQAVTDIDLRIERGCIVGLLGPNGSGKTTLIRMLSTLLRPTSGTARVAGADVAHQPAEVRRHIGLTGQFAAVDSFLTGRENLAMMGRLLGLSRRDAGSRARQLLDAFDLHDAADRLLSTYSGGMRRRLDLALSLTGRPAIVFLDEPTTGLDPRSRLAMWQVIEDLGRQGTTVLLCTQYLEEADRLAERVVILDQGRVVAEGPPARLRADVGADIVEVTLRDPAERAAAQRALQPMSSTVVGARHDTEQPDATVLRIAVQRSDQLADVVRLLDGASIGFSHLTLHEPTLDDVFLALTGRPTTVKSAGAR